MQRIWNHKWPLDNLKFGLFILTALVIWVGVFAYWPELDPMVSAWFYTHDQGFYLKENKVISAINTSVSIEIAIIVTVAAIFSLRELIKVRSLHLKHYPFSLYIALTALVGPGFLAEFALKYLLHRPRPSCVLDFGGVDPYTSIFEVGKCLDDCSFASGHTATAALTIIFALLLPRGVTRQIGLVMASLFTGAIAFARVAVGKHFLSDTLFAVILVLFIAWVFRIALLRAFERK
jgi:lipid A 4'-phosphatase